MASNVGSDAAQSQPISLLDRASEYLSELIAFFTGGSMDAERYAALRRDLLSNPAYEGLAPSFLRKNRDTSALWSFAKSVDPSWDPRRVFLREEFEPLITMLEQAEYQRPVRMPASYDSSAWTGVQSPIQRVKAVRTLMPLAQAAVGALIAQLETPTSNGGPPLDEVEEGLSHLRKLHSAIGELIVACDNGELLSPIGEGLAVEAARYAKRAARALKHDPIPYALSATVLGLLTACGIPGIGGYLSGIALAIRK